MEFECIVQSDPTLKYIMRDAKFDFDLLEHQVGIRCAATKIAINKLIDALIEKIR